MQKWKGIGSYHDTRLINVARLPQQVLCLIHSRKHQGPSNCLDDNNQSEQENSTYGIHLAVQKQHCIE